MSTNDSNAHDRLATAVPQHRRHQVHELLDELDEEQRDGQHQTDVERRQQPAAVEHHPFQGPFERLHHFT
jgi:hypothetical protein